MTHGVGDLAVPLPWLRLVLLFAFSPKLVTAFTCFYFTPRPPSKQENHTFAYY